MKTVLVTRPEPGATRTAERLAAMGYHPLVLPLTMIRPLPVQPLNEQYDAVAVTSANALRHAPKDLLTTLHHLPCFVVGGATAKLASDMGFALILLGNGDGKSLAEKINEATPVDAKVLYLTGQVRSSRFEEIVAESGREVMPILVYDTILKTYETDYLAELFKSSPVDFCLLYSKWSAKMFVNSIVQADICHLFENTDILCLSANIASVVSGLGFGRVRTAITGEEAALLDLLNA